VKARVTISTVPLADAPWARRQVWGLVAFVFAIQVGLIFWLGDRSLVHPRQFPVPSPVLQVANDASPELLALSDPTLFALPHREGFSGLAWLHNRPLPYKPLVWSEPPRLLAMREQDLGDSFQQFFRTNQAAAPRMLGQTEPALRLPPASELKNIARSSLKLVGGLASRKLMRAPELPSFGSADLLGKSVVQLLVDAEGRPASISLLSQSGSVEADVAAMNLARAARFERLGRSPFLETNNPFSGLVWGEMIFEWQTLPLDQTNSVAAESK